MLKQLKNAGYSYKSFLSFAVLLLWIAIPCGHATEREIGWTEDYEAAVQRAAGSNSILLLHFYTDNCPPCKLLEKKTFHDPALVAAINQNVVPTKINADRRRDLATKYNVNRWPMDVYLFPNGDEIYRGVSDQDPSVYTQKIKRIALRHRDWTVEREAIAKSTQRRQDQIIAANTPQIQSEKPTYAGSAGHPVKSQSVAWSGNVQGNTMPGQPVTQDYQATAGAVVAPSRQRTIDNPYIAKQPVEVPPQIQTAPAVPQESAPVVSKRPLSVQPVGSQRELHQHTAPPDRTNDLPVESKPVLAETIGMDGFCPVTLIESLDQSNSTAWVSGSASYAVRHRGRVYYCASEKARQTLLSNPDRFTPGLSGFDLVHFFKTGKLIDGICKFGCIQPNTNRIFIFANQENYQEFERDMEHFSRLLDRVTPERVADRSNETQIR
jgi:YHS domain-containing protein/thiol-disulfide isomerase/thioredoxin